MTSPAPNPYEPTRAPELPSPPRQVGRVGVWLWAMFALALGSPNSVWTPYMKALTEDRKRVLVLGLMGVGPAALGVIWAYVSDRKPLFGSRREGHLLLGCALMVVAWAAGPFVSEQPAWPMGVEFALRAGQAICVAVLGGAVVELARRHQAPGRLAAARIGLQHLGVLFAAAFSALLAERSTLWPAALGAALAISVGLAAAISQEAAPAEPADERTARWPLLRSKAFWAALALLVFVRLFGDVARSPLLTALRREAFARTSGEEGFAVSLVSLLIALVYATLSRRLSTGALLRLSLLARVVGFATWLAPDAGIGADWFGSVARGIADICALIGMTILMVRAAPRGREAFGYALMLVIPNFLSTFTLAVVFGLRLSWIATIAMAIAGSLLALAAVSLLPRELRVGRDAVTGTDGQRVV